ncbi:hypothetical protein M0805_008537 [Coniferiporia weirii]|nr:hypothetical protein M0805_008537 [Coniferiporia weirii]
MPSRPRSQEEDVDDLDDIVEQFDAKPANENRLAPAKAQPDTPRSAATVSSASVVGSVEEVSQTPKDASGPADQLPEELAKQLAEGMESLMRELSGNHHAPSSEERKRQEDWEKMLIDGMNGIGVNEPPSEGLSPPQQSHEDAFQARILQAMEKLKDSESGSATHTDVPSVSPASGDPLEAILSQLAPGLDEPGEDDENLQSMLETMMQQLMSKGVLYEPLKELHEKFPSYLADNDKTLSASDKVRFENQMTRVSQIVAIFEGPSYEEGDKDKGARIVSLMNEMQSFGSPPSEIMGPLPPGLDFSSNDPSDLPEGCTIF